MTLARTPNKLPQLTGATYGYSRYTGSRAAPAAELDRYPDGDRQHEGAMDVGEFIDTYSDGLITIYEARAAAYMHALRSDFAFAESPPPANNSMQRTARGVLKTLFNEPRFWPLVPRLCRRMSAPG